MTPTFEKIDTVQPRELLTSRGEKIVTLLSDNEAIKVLERHRDKLGDFGRDLISAAYSRKGLSPRQIPWLHKLALELLPTDKRPGYTDVTKAQEAPTTILDLTPIRKLMERAALKLTRPKIRFEFTEDPALDQSLRMEQLPARKLAITIASSGSRTPGAIMVSDGGPFGKNVFFGRVHENGRWEPKGAVPEWVLEALRQLAEETVAFVSGYGRKTGRCCFCGLQLTDGRSVVVGYGPICADNYGLPWG